MPNFLSSSNPFNLPPPPAWWLMALRDFDAALVVFPSVMRRVYILGRRRGYSNVQRLAPLVKLNNDLLKLTAGSDGEVMAAHNLVYVDQIIGWGIWTNAIFNILRERDTWAAGGAEKYADKLDAQEDAERLARHAARNDDFEHRANDAWRSLQARTGQRNHHAKNSGLRVRGFAAPAVGGKSISTGSTDSGIVLASRQ